jgi:hypothetical protein
MACRVVDICANECQIKYSMGGTQMSVVDVLLLKNLLVNSKWVCRSFYKYMKFFGVARDCMSTLATNPLLYIRKVRNFSF